MKEARKEVLGGEDINLMLEDLPSLGLNLSLAKIFTLNMGKSHG